MSIPFSGTLKRSGGVASAIAKQLTLVNLKPVKKVQIKFDPFHSNVEQTRYFLFHLSTPKVLTTNLNCSIKTQILCDRSEPSVSFKLINGEEVVFKSTHLSALEMFQLYNKHITVLVPKEDTTKAPITTKSAKQSLKTKRK